MFSFKNKFMVKDSTLFKLIQDANKSFEVLIVSVNFHNLQENAGTNKIYSIIKRDFFWKGMYIDKFIQNCHICRKHNLQKQSYSFIQKLPKRLFDSTALYLIGSFHLSYKINTIVPTYVCLLVNYSIVIPIQVKQLKQLSTLPSIHICNNWWFPYSHN